MILMTKLESFSDKLREIDQILSQKRSFWTLDAIAHLDYQDICQIIRIHLFNKFDQWNQEKPFGPWAASLINNQIINLRQKYYGKFAPPCKGCDYNMGEDKCALTGSGFKTEECEMFAKWEKKKKDAYRLLLAESTDKSYDEDPEGEGRIRIEAPLARDYQRASEKLHGLIFASLNEKMSKIYRWLFIEHRSDDYVALELGYKGIENGKRTRYKQIENIKKILVEKAKSIMAENDIFSNE